MNGRPKPAPPPAPKPQVWFPDTSTLLNMAVHAPLQEAVVAALDQKRRVLAMAVVAELHGLTRSATVGRLARTALGQLAWLGDPVVLDDPDGTVLAVDIQQLLAAGQPLSRPLEHWGESAIIALACRASHLQPFLLSDDYDARIAARARRVEAMSVHKFLYVLIGKGLITDQLAASFARALHSAGRSQDFTAAELRSGRLGRAGKP